MSCPLLKETRVRVCNAAAPRKMIAQNGGTDDLCTTTAYRECTYFAEHKYADDTLPRCPFFYETLMNYCGAVSVPKYIPWSEQSGRCAGDSFRFCEAYLTLARPAPVRAMLNQVDGVAAPTDVWYAPNHMWLHTGDNGACHIGIDGLFARLAGGVERISFVTSSGVQRASVVLTVHGIDWSMVFPYPILITGTNVYLRRNPKRLTEDPYGAGWLFEGTRMPLGGEALSAPPAGLLAGSNVTAWMSQEMERLTSFVHNLRPGVLNDGGKPAPDLLDHLTRDETLRLLHEFFSPHARWTGAL